MSRSTAYLRLAGMAGVGWGVALLTGRDRLWELTGGGRITDADRLALRLLGARHLAQGTFQAALPTTWQPLLISIDVVHAATMVPLAFGDRDRREPAAVSGAVALVSGLAVVTWRGQGTR